MGLRLTHITLTLETTEAGCNYKGRANEINIEASKVVQDYDEALEKGPVEKWKVRVNPHFHSSDHFDLTGGELDGFLEDLSAYRQLIDRIELALGDASKKE